MSEVKIKAKKGDEFLVLSNSGVAAIIAVKIGDKEVLVPGPAIIAAVNVIQADQQFSRLDRMKVA